MIMNKIFLICVFCLISGFNVNAQSCWVLQTSGTKEGLTSVHFNDTNNGYAVGNRGTILNTRNGGANWVADKEVDGNLTSVFSFNNTTYAVGSGYFQSNTPKTLGLIYKKNNYENMWDVTKTKFGYDYFRYGDYLESVYFIHSDTGYAVGSSGLIIKTIDGGKEWSVQSYLKPNEKYYNLHSVFFIDANFGYAVGGNDSLGIILKTNNGGTTWTQQTSGTNQNLNSVCFVDTNTGYAVGGGLWDKKGIILKTIDGGHKWMELSYTSPEDMYYELKSVFFINTNTGYAVGGTTVRSKQGKAIRIDKVDGLILKTIDGGTTWEKQTSGINRVLLSVFFNDNNTGYIVGDRGVILKTTNGGK